MRYKNQNYIVFVGKKHKFVLPDLMLRACNIKVLIRFLYYAEWITIYKKKKENEKLYSIIQLL